MKRWIEYIQLLEQHHPIRYESLASLHAMMLREAPEAVQPDIETFRRVVNGTRPARTGFGAALIRLYDLKEVPIMAEDFDGPLDALAGRLTATPHSSLGALLLKSADGTRLELVERGRRATQPKTFGTRRGPREPVLRAEVSYDLQILRPENAIGVEGNICLLGQGFEDKRWQLVSAVADSPVPPGKVVQWGRATGIRLTSSSQPGRFVLYAVGSAQRFSSALTAIYDRELARLDGDGFLRAKDVQEIQDVIGDAIETGAWSATLNYRVAL